MPRVARVAEDTSFSRIFMTASQHEQQQQQPGAAGGPSVHELFLAFQRDTISREQLGELLGELHGLKFSDQAGKLLRDPNLSFLKFQKEAVRPLTAAGDPFVSSSQGGVAREEEPQPNANANTAGAWAVRAAGGARSPLDRPEHVFGAGVPVRYEDTANAIITDNSGLAAPPEPTRSFRRISDVNQDAELKAARTVANMHGGNPVMRTNRVSVENTLLHRDRGAVAEGDLYAPQEMANTAIRLFLTGEMKQADFQQVLKKMGLDFDAPEHQEVQELIRRQAQVGDRSFSQFSRAIGHRVQAVAAPPPLRKPGYEELRPPRAPAGIRSIPLEAA